MARFPSPPDSVTPALVMKLTVAHPGHAWAAAGLGMLLVEPLERDRLRVSVHDCHAPTRVEPGAVLMPAVRRGIAPPAALTPRSPRQHPEQNHLLQLSERQGKVLLFLCSQVRGEPAVVRMVGLRGR